jgi:hypothetical protein
MTPLKLLTIAILICVSSQFAHAQQPKALNDYPNVVRKFMTLYPSAVNEKWFKVDDFFYVSFMNNDRKVSAVFSLQGAMNYSIAYLHTSDLPAETIQKIKTTYPSDSVFSIKEVKADHINLYEIILENMNQFTVLSVSANEMTEVKKISKS